MQLISFDRKFVAAAMLAAGACAFQPAYGQFAAPQRNMQNNEALRVPGAFSTEAANDTHSLRLDDRAGTDAPTVEVITDRYPDGKTRVERQVTLDTDGNYVNHGTWKMWGQDGTPVAEGQFDMGKRVGTWTRWYGRGEQKITNAAPFRQFKPPFVSQVNFVDDKMEGQWLIVDADERQIMQISLSGGQRHGTAITWLPNGKIAEQSSYNHGVPHGETLQFVANAPTTQATGAKAGEQRGDMRVTAIYVDGRRVTTKTNYHDRVKKTKSTEEVFLAAPTTAQTLDDFWNLSLATYRSEGTELRNGISKSWFADGKPAHDGNYENDRKHGAFTYWYSNGQMLTTGEYKNDKPIGNWIWWHENGLRSAVGECNDEGYFVGEWRWWGPDGKLTNKKEYDGSEKVTFNKTDRGMEVGQRTTEGSTTVR